MIHNPTQSGNETTFSSMSPNAKRETTVAEEKAEGIRRDAKRSDGFLEATTEGLAFHDVLGDAGWVLRVPNDWQDQVLTDLQERIATNRSTIVFG